MIKTVIKQSLIRTPGLNKKMLFIHLYKIFSVMVPWPSLNHNKFLIVY